MFIDRTILANNPKIRLVLVGAAIVFVGTLIAATGYLFHKNGTLRQQLGEQKASYEMQITLLQTNVGRLQTAINEQNDAIQVLTIVGQQYEFELNKAENTVKALQTQTAATLRRYREQEVRTLTCEQSIDLLVQSVPELGWGGQQ